MPPTLAELWTARYDDSECLLGEAGISASKRQTFIVRHRRLIGIVAALATALSWIVHVAHWHWPYRLDGLVRELPLLGVAAGAGVLAALLLARVVPLFRDLGASASGAVVALLAFFIVQSADPFGGARDWRYAPAACDFAVAFPRRAEIVAGEALNDARQSRAVERAQFTDVGRSTSYSAECLDLGRAVEPGDRARLLADAEARLRRNAARLRLTVERIERDGARGLVLHGLSDEGRNAANEPLLRRARARVVLGRASMLVLWTWTVLLGSEAEPPGIARFHESVQSLQPRR